MPLRPKIFLEAPKHTTMQLFATVMLVVLSFFIVLVSNGVMNNKLKKLALASVTAAFSGAETSQPAETAGPVNISALENRLKEGGLLSGTAVSQGRMGAVITLRSDLLFAPGSAELKPKAAQAIDKLAKLLKTVPNQLIVAGHTDSIPIEGGSYGTNWGLSAARAMNVLKRLQAADLPAERLSAYGLGAQHPITTNADEAGRRLNNRVEIMVIGKLPGDKLTEAAPQSQPDDSVLYHGYKFRLDEN